MIQRKAGRSKLVAPMLSAVLAACGGGGGADGGVGVPTIPVLTAQPVSQTTTTGTAVTLSVSATGSALRFRWQVSIDAGLTWADILDSITAQYIIASPTYAMNGYRYRAIVSSTDGEVTSAPVTLTVNRAVAEVFQDCSVNCPQLVVIPTGSYQMGLRAATDVARDVASPLHTVSIGYALAVGRSEVTRAEFARFVQATAYRTDAERGAGCLVSTATATAVNPAASWQAPGFSQTDADPVVCVSWNDAQAYVGWLNTLGGPRNFRLLTEAEWEYVARAGATTSRYPFGDDLTYRLICTYANSGDQTATATVPRFAQTHWTLCADGYGYTAPVEAFPANAFGLRNVIGNAWEWVQDGWHASYAGAPADGSAWAVSGSSTNRVYRGGSWNNHPTYLDPAYRANGVANFAEEGLGFRVARTL